LARLAADRENREFLSDFPFPDTLVPESALDVALEGVEDVLVVVPSHAFAEVVASVAPLIGSNVGVTWATKGLDQDGRLLHQVAQAYLGDAGRLAVISGPTFAKEVARNLPTAVTVASSDASHARHVASLLHSERFRAYTSRDIVGVQVGGAAKNVLAIAAGIADGLGFGANTRAALITRGLRELTRFGVRLGGNDRTFVGLAGLGDLALTCTDDQSRNRRMGLCLARGMSVEAARRQIGQEVEGVGTTRVVYRRARELDVEMPIAEQVYRVLYEEATPDEATHALLERSSRSELD
jgi:glycerol-3-phosphate dehydrogenase (NAD(P)+)